MGRHRYIALSLTLLVTVLIPGRAFALSYDEIMLLVQAERKVFGQPNNTQSFDDRIKALEQNQLGGAGSGSDSQRLKAVCRKLGLIAADPNPPAQSVKSAKSSKEELRALKTSKLAALHVEPGSAGHVQQTVSNVAPEQTKAQVAKEERIAAQKAAEKQHAEERKLKAEQNKIAQQEIESQKRKLADEQRLQQEQKRKQDVATAAELKTNRAKEESVRLSASRIAADKVAADKIAADHAADIKAEVDKAADDRAVADRVAANKATAEKAAAEKAAAEKAAAEKAAAEKLASDKTAADKTSVDRATADQIASSKLSTNNSNAEDSAQPLLSAPNGEGVTSTATSTAGSTTNSTASDTGVPLTKPAEGGSILGYLLIAGSILLGIGFAVYMIFRAKAHGDAVRQLEREEEQEEALESPFPHRTSHENSSPRVNQSKKRRGKGTEDSQLTSNQDVEDQLHDESNIPQGQTPALNDGSTQNVFTANLQSNTSQPQALAPHAATIQPAPPPARPSQSAQNLSAPTQHPPAEAPPTPVSAQASIPVQSPERYTSTTALTTGAHPVLSEPDPHSFSIAHLTPQQSQTARPIQDPPSSQFQAQTNAHAPISPQNPSDTQINRLLDAVNDRDISDQRPPFPQSGQPSTTQLESPPFHQSAQPQGTPLEKPPFHQSAQPQGTPLEKPAFHQSAQPQGTPSEKPAFHQSAQPQGTPSEKPPFPQSAQPQGTPLEKPPFPQAGPVMPQPSVIYTEDHTQALSQLQMPHTDMGQNSGASRAIPPVMLDTATMDNNKIEQNNFVQSQVIDPQTKFQVLVEPLSSGGKTPSSNPAPSGSTNDSSTDQNQSNHQPSAQELRSLFAPEKDNPNAINYKVCPNCSAAFSMEAQFCDQDNARLMVAELNQSISDDFGERYEIKSVLGSGGMSVAYCAMHKSLNKMVALKQLGSNLLQNAAAIERFQREAQMVTQLNHPNVVRVPDFGITNSGYPFMVMDLLHGKTVAQVLAQHTTLPPARVKRIMLQCASGLGHAHQHGIIHRDVKPNNIVLEKDHSGDDLVKLVDFGIAKLVAEIGTEQLTRSGEVFGTAVYMSPEQCRGSALDSRSDIFSLGCVMFELLTGLPPFEGKNDSDTFQMIISSLTPSLKEQCPEMPNPAAFEWVITKSLEKDPRDRYQSMEELMRDLVRVPV